MLSIDSAGLIVLDPEDNDIALASLWADRPVALALVRHFG